jgi:hypothetical protein
LLKLLSRTLQIAQSKVANHMLLARGYPDWLQSQTTIISLCVFLTKCLC